ncbi:hypothetical protein [Flavobacterium sp. '19STA2R22 D10 B1']|uniref:hypothetical protein n=1 Tax=Flavobacterium aerium TaxID=3037261 RepID=UPI00278BDB04|nr:hypothetical protein [Flavobacterium sp. '19STA2R22 D10 B1']
MKRLLKRILYSNLKKLLAPIIREVLIEEKKQKRIEFSLTDFENMFKDLSSVRPPKG